MSTANSRRFRDARDRLIDLLGFGETYPLRDLPVRDERLTVPFGAAAGIPIETSQKGARYGLLTKDGDPAGTRRVGDGKTLVLTTPRIVEDITYTVQARKPSGRTAELIETATVKVGLDVGLKAALLPPVPQPPIVAFATPVEVEIAQSQEGVDYRLVHFPAGEPADATDVAAAANDAILSANDASVRGTGAAIVLRSKPMAEDTVIRIRATKIFDAAEARPPQTDILTVRLPLFVRADPGLAVTTATAPIVDFRADAGIRIAASQASARYQAFSRRIADADFRQGTPVGAAGMLRIPVAGEDDAIIAAPVRPADGSDLPGFAPLGDEQAGTGGELAVTLPAAAEDTFVIVRASKRHALADGSTVTSAEWLAGTAAILVRPDPAPAVRLVVVIDGGRTTGSLGIDGGQPGVFYLPRSVPAGPPFALPAYVHRRDADDARFNKGLGQLKLNVDFVLATDPPADTAVLPPAEAPPAMPVLAGPPLAVGTRIALTAIKAQSRVGADLAAEAEIGAAPPALLEAAVIDHGQEARLTVIASRTDETYALLRDGVVVAPARDGNGAELRLSSGPLLTDAVIELAVHPKSAAIPVERRLAFAVTVNPPGG